MLLPAKQQQNISGDVKLAIALQQVTNGIMYD
jgi:hypothetical protein